MNHAGLQRLRWDEMLCVAVLRICLSKEIELVGFLEKGLGKTHAKWSPVATAVYRLEPEFGECILLPTVDTYKHFYIYCSGLDALGSGVVVRILNGLRRERASVSALGSNCVQKCT